MFKKNSDLSTKLGNAHACISLNLHRASIIATSIAASCLCLIVGCASEPSATLDASNSLQLVQQNAPVDDCYQLATCELVAHFTNGLGENCRTLRSLEKGNFIDYCVDEKGKFRKLKALND